MRNSLQVAPWRGGEHALGHFQKTTVSQWWFSEVNGIQTEDSECLDVEAPKKCPCPAACASLWRLLRLFGDDTPPVGRTAKVGRLCVVHCVGGLRALAHRQVLLRGRGREMYTHMTQPITQKFQPKPEYRITPHNRLRRIFAEKKSQCQLAGMVCREGDGDVLLCVNITPHLTRVAHANTFSRVAQVELTCLSVHCCASFLKTVILTGAFHFARAMFMA